MRVLLIVCGCMAMILGIMGIFLPLLPTTPFLLLAAACFFRSSPRLYQWLINHKQMGPYIRNFREHKAIPLKAKIISVSMVWITMLIAAFGVVPYLWIRIGLLLLAAAISWHILSYKTLK